MSRPRPRVDPARIYTLQEAAALVGCTPRTLSKHMRKPKRRKFWRATGAEILAWCEGEKR